MHCKNCGKEIEEGAYVCKHCGVATNIDYPKYNVEPNDNIGCFPMVISFDIPIVGFILYFDGNQIDLRVQKLQQSARGQE